MVLGRALSSWYCLPCSRGSWHFFLPRALCGAFVTVVMGVVAVCPEILRCFIAPDVVGEIPAVESDGDVGSPNVPVVVVIATALAALVIFRS